MTGLLRSPEGPGVLFCTGGFPRGRKCSLPSRGDILRLFPGNGSGAPKAWQSVQGVPSWALLATVAAAGSLCPERRGGGGELAGGATMEPGGRQGTWPPVGSAPPARPPSRAPRQRGLKTYECPLWAGTLCPAHSPPPRTSLCISVRGSGDSGGKVSSLSPLAPIPWAPFESALKAEQAPWPSALPPGHAKATGASGLK